MMHHAPDMMPPKKTRALHRWLRGLGWFLLLMLLALLAGACWLWSWRWGGKELEFHESWTAEERAALVAFDSYLRGEYIEDCFMYEYMDIPQVGKVIFRAYMKKQVAAPLCGQLQQIVRQGDARLPGVDLFFCRGMTPAIVAAQTGQFPALKALVQHGADPNACLLIVSEDKSIEAETPLTPLLAGNFSDLDMQIPWSERREVAEFLLARGADLNAHQRIAGLCCTVALMHGDDAPWHWVLERGLKVTGEQFGVVMCHPEARLELIEAMLKSTPGLANACDSGRTMLQHLVRDVSYDAESCVRMEPVLRLLLQYGADPAMLPPARADEYIEDWLPLEYLKEHPPCKSRSRKDSAEDTPAYAAWKRMCDMLQA